MSNKSDNIDIPQPNVEEVKEKEKAHSGLWYSLNPWAKKEKTTMVPTPLKEEEILFISDIINNYY